MASDEQTPTAQATQSFLQHLETTGFFQQLADIETSIKSIAEEVDSFTRSADERRQEGENLAAHILAIEALLSALLAKSSVEEQAVIEEVRRQATAVNGDAAVNPTVQAVALDLLRKARQSG